METALQTSVTQILPDSVIILVFLLASTELLAFGMLEIKLLHYLLGCEHDWLTAVLVLLPGGVIMYENYAPYGILWFITAGMALELLQGTCVEAVELFGVSAQDISTAVKDLGNLWMPEESEFLKVDSNSSG